MSTFKKPITVMLPPEATDAWKEMYGPPRADQEKAKTLADAFDDDEEDEDDDEGDDEEPEEFPEEYPSEEP